MHFEMEAIALVHSPYKEKFAVPRQPGLVPSCRGRLEIMKPFDDLDAFIGLDEFSHLWLTFIFHKNKEHSYKPMVRPPRLGGNKKKGVFATRSPFRPNPIGLSLVEFHGIEEVDGKIFLLLGDIDLVDGTPVIDIKPYIAYADSKPQALCSFAAAPPETFIEINFSSEAETKLIEEKENYYQLRELIVEVIGQDPRPAYKKNKPDPKVYAMLLLDFNIKWKIDEGQNSFTVIAIDNV